MNNALPVLILFSVRHPILLDELIAPHYLNAPPKPDEYMAMLREKLLRIDPDDLEDQMEELRLFKKIMVLRIAMSDRAESLPLMKIKRFFDLA